VPGTNLITDIATKFSADLNSAPDANGVIIQGGVNDLIEWNGVTPVYADQLAAMQLAITTMSSEAVSRGLTVMYVNVLPWGGHGGWTADKQLMTTEFNVWLSNYAGQTGALLVDGYSLLQAQTGWDERIDPAYGGPLHPNEAGAVVLATAVEAVILDYRDTR